MKDPLKTCTTILIVLGVLGLTSYLVLRRVPECGRPITKERMTRMIMDQCIGEIVSCDYETDKPLPEILNEVTPKICDAWGQELRFIYSISNGDVEYGVISSGPDREFNTKDDLFTLVSHGKPESWIQGKGTHEKVKQLIDAQ